MKRTILTVLLTVMLCVDATHCQAQDPVQTQAQAQAQTQTKTLDLFDAARADDVKTVQAYIDKKVDLNQVDESGFTALTLASYNGSPHVVALLLQHGASTEILDPMGRSSLMAAAFQGDAESIKLLLAHDAKVNVVDANGATALMYAVEFGRKAVIKPLLDAKADATIRDKRGYTALSIAKGQDDPEIYNMLTSKPAK
jgi:ankyrin repeat protein